MALISLIGPILKGILGAELDGVTSGKSRCCSKVIYVLLLAITVMGVFFAFSGLYELFNSIYSPAYAKGYMALACFASSIAGLILYCIIKWIGSIFQKPKGVPTVVNTAEQQSIDIMKIIQNEGLQLIKQHPFAAALIGVTIGLLSGASSSSKK